MLFNKHSETKQRFGIRKLTIGATSVLLSTLFLTVNNGQKVHAVTDETVTNADNKSGTEDNAVTTENSETEDKAQVWQNTAENSKKQITPNLSSAKDTADTSTAVQNNSNQIATQTSNIEASKSASNAPQAPQKQGTVDSPRLESAPQTTQKQSKAALVAQQHSTVSQTGSSTTQTDAQYSVTSQTSATLRAAQSTNKDVTKDTKPQVQTAPDKSHQALSLKGLNASIKPIQLLASKVAQASAPAPAPDGLSDDGLVATDDQGVTLSISKNTLGEGGQLGKSGITVKLSGTVNAGDIYTIKVPNLGWIYQDVTDSQLMTPGALGGFATAKKQQKLLMAIIIMIIK